MLACLLAGCLPFLPSFLINPTPHSPNHSLSLILQKEAGYATNAKGYLGRHHLVLPQHWVGFFFWGLWDFVRKEQQTRACLCVRAPAAEKWWELRLPLACLLPALPSLSACPSCPPLPFLPACAHSLRSSTGRPGAPVDQTRTGRARPGALLLTRTCATPATRIRYSTWAEYAANWLWRFSKNKINQVTLIMHYGTCHSLEFFTRGKVSFLTK
jgi:hypothetical protein